MRRLTSMMAAGVLLLGASTAWAQGGPAPRHTGFWIGVGLGGGWHNVQGAADEAVGGGTLYVRLGGTPNERILLGGEINGWARTGGDVTDSRGNATFTLLYYPRRRGFFVKGGVGAASASSETQSGAVTITETHTGLGTTVGLGVDFRLARNFYLTPNLDFLVQRINDVESNLVLLSLGVTWH